MSEKADDKTQTLRLGLPYVQAAQAQKHVTVNESLAILDDMHQLAVASRGLAAPPVALQAGVRYLTADEPEAASAWKGKGGKIAVYRDGGWFFYTPQAGTQIYVMDESQALIFDGKVWRTAGTTGNEMGAHSFMAQDVAEVVLATDTGASVTTELIIPDRAIVMAVGCLVATAIKGTASFAVGVSGSDNRYGEGLHTGRNSRNLGVTVPTPYYARTPVILSARGGNFTAGRLFLTLYYLALTPPDYLV